MHPVFTNRAAAFVYLGVWTGLAVALSSLLRQLSVLSWGQALLIAGALCVLLAFMCMTPWYTCRTLPFGSTERRRIVWNHGAAAIIVTAIWVAFARGLAWQMGVNLSGSVPILIALGLLLYYLSVAIHYAYFAVESSRRAALEARDAELRALKAQINPHFLFNSLNSIAALTVSDGLRAREMCIRLSEFLRNTLGLGERENIAWKDELELVRAYLDVEKVRFGSRLEVEMNVAEACSECQVPPLVLQPLIENAVKHGIATLVEGGKIRVDGEVKDGLLRVRVENKFDPDSPAPRRHGLGLRNVRTRLVTRFGPAASLTASKDDNLFGVEMVFPCHKTE